MRRKVFKGKSGRIVLYIIDDYVCVSEIISELCSLGCRGKELTRAYKILISDAKDYSYTNKESGDTLIVVENTRPLAYSLNVVLV